MSEYDLLDTKSGNSVVAAIDHGLSLGAAEGFRDPEATLQSILKGGPDAVLVGPHFARHYNALIKDAGVDTVVTADIVSSSTRPGFDDGQDIWTPGFDTELLLDLDPKGVKIVLVFGRDDRQMFVRNLSYIAKMAEELRGTDIPLVVEPVMWGSRVPTELETHPEYVSRAARMAWEYGADILKLPYTGDPVTFEPIVKNAPIPVMILGGPNTGSTLEMLTGVEGAIASGARGIMIGRSIWKTDDPTSVVRALEGIVHDGKSADDVWDV
ncbi:class I fructose-bisphosphate aldolase [Halobellus rarus]|uniref:fructose-bisphosphate aldolase n=1 Tax=Halobellus rarus TaxID=1126237 RepID=A0ABD6CQS6_9EURY|nr:fructose-1,6-bisphosphate aldolase [Halobellus rarus]